MTSSTFRSLAGHNYRIWAAGAIVSNVGTWMGRTAQDWLVLTGLTHRSGTAVGIVVACQFGPQQLLLPVTGFAADHLDRRRLLLATQTSLPSCSAARRRSTRRRGRASCRNWSARPTCPTRWR